MKASTKQMITRGVLGLAVVITAILGKEQLSQQLKDKVQKMS